MGALPIVKPGEKLVYSHEGRPDELQAATCDTFGVWKFVGMDDKPHLYLNCDFDTYDVRVTRRGVFNGERPVACSGCGHGYSELRMTVNIECSECKLDQLFEWSMHVQDSCGVDLGWDRPDVEHRRYRMARGDVRVMHVERKR